MRAKSTPVQDTLACSALQDEPERDHVERVERRVLLRLATAHLVAARTAVLRGEERRALQRS